MAQPLLKRRLNPLLLISTVAALVLVAGVSVVALDRIDQMQEESKQVVKQLQDKNQTIEELEAEKENLSLKLENVRQEYSKAEAVIDEKDSEIENKTQEINELESQINSLEQDTGDNGKVEEINDSLRIVCWTGASWQSKSIAQENCQEWGHDIEG